MKRLLLLMMVLTAVLALGACAGTQPGDTSTAAGAAAGVGTATTETNAARAARAAWGPAWPRPARPLPPARPRRRRADPADPARTSVAPNARRVRPRLCIPRTAARACPSTRKSRTARPSAARPAPRGSTRRSHRRTAAAACPTEARSGRDRERSAPGAGPHAADRGPRRGPLRCSRHAHGEDGLGLFSPGRGAFPPGSSPPSWPGRPFSPWPRAWWRWASGAPGARPVRQEEASLRSSGSCCRFPSSAPLTVHQLYPFRLSAAEAFRVVGPMLGFNLALTGIGFLARVGAGSALPLRPAAGGAPGIDGAGVRAPGTQRQLSEPVQRDLAGDRGGVAAQVPAQPLRQPVRPGALLGYRPRWSALALAGTCVAVALLGIGHSARSSGSSQARRGQEQSQRHGKADPGRRRRRDRRRPGCAGAPEWEREPAC